MAILNRGDVSKLKDKGCGEGMGCSDAFIYGVAYQKAETTVKQVEEHQKTWNKHLFMFTDNNQKDDSPNIGGDALYKFIKKHKLGKVVKSYSAPSSHGDGSSMFGYIWSVPPVGEWPVIKKTPAKKPKVSWIKEK